MPIQPVVIQKRMRELGRVRLGQKGDRGQPEKLDTFRITSASRALLEAIAATYGGTVSEWSGAPDEGYWQIVTDATELRIVFPPTFADDDGTPTIPVSQDFELWSGGGCQRRCDGVVEAFTGKACLCDPDKRACKPTTRMSFMLPDIPGLGVWRVESHGYNAAAELPGVVAVLANAAHDGKFIPAVLRLEHRTKKREGQTRRFVVPVIDLPDVTIEQLAAGDAPLALNATRPAPPRPALPAAIPEPEPQDFDLNGGANGDPEFGEPAPLPSDGTPKPLSKAAFADRLRDAQIDGELLRSVGAELFPGKSAAGLTNAQRGQLWAALEQRTAGKATA